jgi:hypothetical protein
VGTGRHDGGGGAGMTARLELVWPGKDKFLLVPKDVDGKPVWVERDHPAASEVRLTDVTGSVGEVPNEPFNANLLFTGDSLDVLRVLTEVPEYRSRYRGKVKLVYIDPPFWSFQRWTPAVTICAGAWVQRWPRCAAVVTSGSAGRPDLASRATWCRVAHWPSSAPAKLGATTSAIDS